MSLAWDTWLRSCATWNNLGWKWSWRSLCPTFYSEQATLWKLVSPRAFETCFLIQFLEFNTMAIEILPTTEGLVTANKEQPRAWDILSPLQWKNTREKKEQITTEVTSLTYQVNVPSSRSHIHQWALLSWVKQ